MKDVAMVLARFCDRNVRDFVPQSDRMREKYEGLGEIHRRCLQILLDSSKQATWEQSFGRDFERRLARFYFESWSGRWTRTLNLDRIAKLIEADLRLFGQLAPQTLNDSPNRDLLKLEQMADLLKHYNDPVKAHAFLLAVCQALPVEGRAILEQSSGYQQIVRWGATQFLKDFWFLLQKAHGITHTAIKGQAAQNLAQSLGEAETQSRQQKESYEDRIAELEEKLAQAYEKSAVELAKRLQERPSPLLPQIAALCRLLQARFEQQGTLPDETMNALIVMEDLLQALEEIGIVRYPNDETLVLTQEQLRDYSYLKGQPFKDASEQKLVRCVRPGWKACGQVISAAAVEEIAPVGDREKIMGKTLEQGETV